MALHKLERRNYGRKLPVSIKYQNLHTFKEGLILLCQSVLKTRRITHLHGSAHFTIPLTHQKIKNFHAQFYSWDFEAKNDDETEVQDKEAIKIVIEEDEDSEVVKPKKKGKLPQIHDSDDRDVEEGYNEVIRPKVKRKPRICVFLLFLC